VYYKCVKLHKNPISRLGGVALTRYMDGWTDGQGDSYIPPKLCLWGYNYTTKYESFRTNEFKNLCRSHNSWKIVKSKWWYNKINYTWPIILPNMKVIRPMIEQTNTEKLYDLLLSYAEHKKHLFWRKQNCSSHLFSLIGHIISMLN
jgi:hypothetical protein